MALFFLIVIIAQMSVLENWVPQSCALKLEQASD